jgi:hypothetical protein
MLMGDSDGVKYRPFVVYKAKPSKTKSCGARRSSEIRNVVKQYGYVFKAL